MGGRMAKVLVFRGSKAKTVGGMTATSLTKNKHGRVVSKKRSALSKKSLWIAAVTKARKALVTAAIQRLFLLNADLFLLTTLPCLFLVREVAVIPPTVLALEPRKTKTFAILPLAILLTAFFFMAH